MKGLVADGKGNVEFRSDIPRPQVSDYTAIVKTIACGICNGTDVKLKEGHLNGFDTYPAVLGHESVGRVIETGKKVTSFKKGDLVLRSGLDDMSPACHSLWGSFGEYGRVTDYRAMAGDGMEQADINDISQQVIPSAIDPVDGVMIITLKEVCAAVKRLGVGTGDKVVVSGCGPVGLAMVKFCKLAGASFVALSGHHDGRLEIAGKLGADLAVNSKKENFAEALKKEVPGKLDFYIDAVGRCDIISEALGLIRDDGVIGVYGIGLEEDRGIIWRRGPYNFKIHSVQWPVPEIEASVHEEVIRYVETGEIDLKDFVTHRLPIEDYEKGFELIRNRQCLKVALYYEERREYPC